MSIKLYGDATMNYDTEKYSVRTLTIENYIQILAKPNAPEFEAQTEAINAAEHMDRGYRYVRLKFFPDAREEREFLEVI